jgi:WD40 repeat protein
VFYDLSAKTLREFNIPLSGSHLAFSHNGQFFACSDKSHVVRLYNVTTGELVQERKSDDPIISLAVSVDDQAIAAVTRAAGAGQFDNQVHLWQNSLEFAKRWMTP